MTVFALAELQHRELASSKTGEKFSLSSVLTQLLGFKDVFIHHEIIPPGRRASSPHKHSEREEMILVLEGCPTAHQGNSSFELKPGDCIGFLPNSPELHFLENRTEAPVRCLVVCSNPQNDRTIYS